jgi:ribosomal protein S18 acetylase RimI-like enzyme
MNVFMSIRDVNEKDIPQIVRLGSGSSSETMRKRVKYAQKNMGKFFLYLKNEEIIGQIYLRFYNPGKKDRYVGIEDLYVRKDSRNEGIGTELIRFSENCAKENGYMKIVLAVNPTYNKQAKRLYERLGYKENGTPPYVVEVVDNFENIAIDMEKTLS